jgi:hypothetical protein
MLRSMLEHGLAAALALRYLSTKQTPNKNRRVVVMQTRKGNDRCKATRDTVLLPHLHSGIYRHRKTKNPNNGNADRKTKRLAQDTAQWCAACRNMVLLPHLHSGAPQRGKTKNPTVANNEQPRKRLQPRHSATMLQSRLRHGLFTTLALRHPSTRKTKTSNKKKGRVVAMQAGK